MSIKQIENLIEAGKTKMIGKGEIEKDSWYEVHEYEGKIYAAILYDSNSCWLMDDMTKEIKESEIKDYV